MSTTLELGTISDDQDITKRLEETIDNNDIVIISKSTCPFCLEAKTLFDSLGAVYVSIETDKEPSGDAIRANLLRRTKQKTVPYIYIFQNLIGGCDDLKRLHANGELTILLSTVMNVSTKHNEKLQRYLFPEENPTPEPVHDSVKLKTVPASEDTEQTSEEQRNTNDEEKAPDAETHVDLEDQPPSKMEETIDTGRKYLHLRPSLFAFPSTVDNNVVRISGGISFCVCIVAIVGLAMEKLWGSYLVFGMFIDFLLRFYGGAAVSPMGATATMLAFPFVPSFSPGPPKQFALLCGVLFTGLATLSTFLGSMPAAIVFIVCLLGANFLQSFVDFCIACFFFGLAIQFGILDSSVYRVHLNEKPEKLPAWKRQNISQNFVNVPAQYPLKGDVPETVLKTQGKIDDQKWFTFSAIKHGKIEYFLIPLSLAALALVWYELEDRSRYNDVPNETWKGIWIISMITFTFLFVAYVCKIAFYTKRVIKEFNSPAQGHLFLVIPTIFSLYTALAVGNGGNERSALNLWWTGAVLTALLTVVKLSELLFDRHSLEHANPLWLVSPIANLVCGVASQYLANDRFGEVATQGFYFTGTGIVLIFILLPPLFFKAILDHHSDDRSRPAIAMFTAAIAFLSPALAPIPYLAMCCFLCSFTLAMVLFAGWMKNFFGNPSFSIEYWAFSFAASAVAFGALNYDANLLLLESKNLVYISTAVASTVTTICGVLSLRQILKLKMFTPFAKFGPMSFMKLTHEAFREHIPKLAKLCGAIGEDAKKDSALLSQLTEEFYLLVRVHDIHSKHEEKAIFPVLQKYVPGITNTSSGEHEAHHVQIREMARLIQALHSNIADKAALEGLKLALSTFGEELLDHLRQEERSASVVVSKLLSVDQQKDIVRSVDSVTSFEEWSILVRWMIENLHIEYQRVKYVRTLLWAMPEKSQFFGGMVFRNCPETNYAKIVAAVPELIPRGLPGHVRYP